MNLCGAAMTYETGRTWKFVKLALLTAYTVFIFGLIKLSGLWKRIWGGREETAEQPTNE